MVKWKLPWWRVIGKSETISLISSISLLARAIHNGRVSVRIPHQLITDWAGNELAGDLTESIVVEKQTIVVSWRAIAVSFDKIMKPILILEFNKQVQISDFQAAQSIIVSHPRISAHYIVMTEIIHYL